MILLLCDDLLFSSRITGVARSHGLDVKIARSPQDLLALAQAQVPACALLDLHVGALDISTLIPALKAAGNPFLVGYGSHVDAATLKAARDAGCDLVLPRSKFVELLPDQLPQWASPQR